MPKMMDDAMAEVEVRPSKVVAVLGVISPFVLLGFAAFCQPLSSGGTTWADYIDSHVNKIALYLLFFISIIGVWSLKKYRISSSEIHVARLVLSGEFLEVKVSDIKEILPSRLPRFISAAHRSYRLKLKSGAQLSIPYDYVNSQKAVEFLRMSVESRRADSRKHPTGDDFPPAHAAEGRRSLQGACISEDPIGRVSTQANSYT